MSTDIKGDRIAGFPGHTSVRMSTVQMFWAWIGAGEVWEGKMMGGLENGSSEGEHTGPVR